MDSLQAHGRSRGDKGRYVMLRERGNRRVIRNFIVCGGILLGEII